MADILSDIKPINTRSGLPDDYPTLSKEGRRLARVNACRQWILPGTPAQRSQRLIQSTWLFDQLYLHPKEDYDPGFYDMPPLPTPQIHWQLSDLWAKHRASIAVLARGSGKSYHGFKDSILRLISYPGFSIVNATSTSDNSKKTGQVIQEQCYTNELIQEDWGPTYEVTSLKPMRGEKMTGIAWFYLKNRSWARQVSVRSRLRGARPRKFRLDDPEYDGTGSTNTEQLRSDMANFIFSIVLPMVMRHSCTVDWEATFVSKRHYAWSAMSTFIDPNTGMELATDPRFNYWGRLIIPAASIDPATGHLISCWREMWPETVEIKKQLRLFESVSLEEIRAQLGEASFRSEYMADPGTAEDAFFPLVEIPEGPQAVHAWWPEAIDQAYLDHEYMNSSALMCYVNKEGEVTKTPMRDFLKETRRFATVDTAYTEKVTSDRKCVNLMACTSNNELFVLDMWSDRKKDAVLMEKTFHMCARWGCPTIYVEVVKSSFHLYQRFREAVHTRYYETLGLDTPVVVKDLRPGMTAKTDKISSLDTRFENNLIKLPLTRRSTNPAITRLIDQIVGFNPNVSDGGLDNDDEVDTLSMSLFVMKGRLRSFIDGTESKDPDDPLENLARGQVKDRYGRSYAHGLNLNEIPVDTIHKLVDAYESRKLQPRGSRV
jgi:hypothetical protein